MEGIARLTRLVTKSGGPRSPSLRSSLAVFGVMLMTGCTFFAWATGIPFDHQDQVLTEWIEIPTDKQNLLVETRLSTYQKADDRPCKLEYLIFVLLDQDSKVIQRWKFSKPMKAQLSGFPQEIRFVRDQALERFIEGGCWDKRELESHNRVEQ